MDTRAHTNGHGCSVNDKVANLAEEIVLISVPVNASLSVLENVSLWP